MPHSRLPEFIERLTRLEQRVEQHFKDSIRLQNNLDWNTRITIAILIAVIGKLCVEYFSH